MSDALTELFGDTLKGKTGDVPVVESLKDADVIGIYFSAHWCPPCRSFTPLLAKVYTDLRKNGKQFQIVFASSDRDEKSFDEYYDDMPWLALPYKKSDLKEKLSAKYGVKGIPTLILLNSEGETIAMDGRAKVSSNPDGFPWTDA